MNGADDSYIHFPCEWITQLRNPIYYKIHIDPHNLLTVKFFPHKTRRLTRPQTQKTMTESPTQSSQPRNTDQDPLLTNDLPETTPQEIPVEIISNEEMALIEAAFAATRSAVSSSTSTSSSISSSHLQRNARSIKSITLLSKRKLSDCSSIVDIEDVGMGSVTSSPMKKVNRVTQSFLHRFRRKRGLSVTDITATEWCEKQMEFFLLLGKPEKTEAMKVGIARHTALEEEAVKKVKVEVKSKEDVWALRLVNFIVGVHQLLFQGLTRELPIIGFVEGVWIVGAIDEIRMPLTESERFPTLVDTKTRVRATLPAEPQQRNGRLQLMCYKHLWDTLVADKFPSGQFFDFFSLNPNLILSAEIRENTAKAGYPAETLSDLVRYYKNTLGMLPPAHGQLLLRYELQEDKSLLGEDQFAYDPDWLQDQIKCCLELWLGHRGARYTPKEERWKCRFCKFEFVCPATTEPDDGTQS